MALVDDDHPVAGEAVSEIVAAGKRLQAGEIDDSGQAGSPGSELSGFDAKKSLNLGSPLVQQRLPIAHDEGRDVVLCDQRAGDHCLAGAGWSDEETLLMFGERIVGCLLRWPEVRGESEFDLLSDRPVVADVEFAPRVGDELLDSLE